MMVELVVMLKFVIKAIQEHRLSNNLLFEGRLESVKTYNFLSCFYFNLINGQII